ncbi:MAG TPA: glycosyltransferase [Panacibacter sp.]|nr:glycosyltransferase [Panacibacter sp.]
MEKNELVSVIMPAYNCEKFIGQSIESVINQTYQNWELIIVDDGSSDNTKNIISGYISKDPRIKYFYQQNGKQGRARNTAISNSSGSLIAFLDADDLWLPKKLERQVLLIDHMKADAVFAYITHIDSKGQWVARGETGSDHEFYYGDSGLSFFFRMNIIPVFTVLAKRNAILHVNGFREDDWIQNIEDYDLWLRMLYSNSKFLLINEVLGAYRIHENQTVKGKLSVLKILRMLTEMKIKEEKLANAKIKAIRLWMIRCLNYDITKTELQKIISYYPYGFGRNFFSMLFNIIPQSLMVKMVKYSCKEQLVKNSILYLKQKTIYAEN